MSRTAGVRALARSVVDTLGWRVGGTLVLTIAVALGEGAVILLLVPLLRRVGIESGAGVTGAVDRAVGRVFEAAGVEPALSMVLALYVAAVALQATVGYAESWARAWVQHSYVLRLRERLYDTVAHARWEFLSRTRATELTHAVVAEAERVGLAVSFLVYFASQVATGVVYTALALRLSAPVTGAALAAGGVLALVSRRSTARARRAGEDSTRDDAALLDAASTQVDALKVVKSYGAEARYVEAFGAAAGRVQATRVRTDVTYAEARWVSAVGGVVVLGAALYLAADRLQLAPAALLLLMLVFSRLVPRIAAAQQSWHHLAHQLPAFASVSALRERCERERQPAGATAGRMRLRDGVRLEEVRFSYGDGGESLAGVSLLIAAGRITALVGPSGSGKTTLADVVAGLLRPSAGRVEVDGAALDGAAGDAWRRSIGYVTQEPVIFRGTIRENLMWVRPDATDADLWGALRRADAADFVARMPGGLDAALGDRGTGLSGGERQRLALARALLREPTLLILDEVTSALDAASEARVLEAVAGLRGEVTVLACTHRPALAALADAVHRVEGGRITESGTPPAGARG
jgi:ATP-binding cassette subfamily C protein